MEISTMTGEVTRCTRGAETAMLTRVLIAGARTVRGTLDTVEIQGAETPTTIAMMTDIEMITTTGMVEITPIQMTGTKSVLDKVLSA